MHSRTIFGPSAVPHNPHPNTFKHTRTPPPGGVGGPQTFPVSEDDFEAHGPWPAIAFANTLLGRREAGNHSKLGLAPTPQSTVHISLRVHIALCLPLHFPCPPSLHPSLQPPQIPRCTYRAPSTPRLEPPARQLHPHLHGRGVGVPARAPLPSRTRLSHLRWHVCTVDTVPRTSCAMEGNPWAFPHHGSTPDGCLCYCTCAQGPLVQCTGRNELVSGHVDTNKRAAAPQR